jgi:hypothetical protein
MQRGNFARPDCVYENRRNFVPGNKDLGDGRCIHWFDGHIYALRIRIGMYAYVWAFTTDRFLYKYCLESDTGTFLTPKNNFADLGIPEAFLKQVNYRVFD